ncbi:unnamed protein product [Dicrocoelium dendriticum]|nr:unnamed protein product [Dicrocoelium dendriticum]
MGAPYTMWNLQTMIPTSWVCYALMTVVAVMLPTSSYGQDSEPISNCSRNFTGNETGVILSPGYPESYGDEEFCNYAITVPANKQINLTFTVARLERRLELLLDFIVIFDGVDCMSKRIAAVVDLSTPSFISSNNSMVALFASDATHRRGPFAAEFSAVSKQTPTKPVSPPPHNHILETRGWEIRKDVGNFTYRGELGWNYLCIWRITVSPGRKMLLNFAVISITYGGSWLRVLDGGDCGAPTVYFLPGFANALNVTLNSTSNTMMVVYAALAGRKPDLIVASFSSVPPPSEDEQMYTTTEILTTTTSTEAAPVLTSVTTSVQESEENTSATSIATAATPVTDSTPTPGLASKNAINVFALVVGSSFSAVGMLLSWM